MSTVLVNPYRFGGGSSAIVVSSEVGVYEPANASGTDSTAAWADGTANGHDMVRVGTGCPSDANGGFAFDDNRNGLAYPTAMFSAGTEIVITAAYTYNAATGFYLMGSLEPGGSIAFNAADASGSAASDSFWATSATLYVGGSSYTAANTRNEVHDALAVNDVFTIVFSPTSNFVGKDEPAPIVLNTGTSVSIHGAVLYTDSADRATAESYASANWVPSP